MINEELGIDIKEVFLDILECISTATSGSVPKLLSQRRTLGLLRLRAMHRRVFLARSVVVDESKNSLDVMVEMDPNGIMLGRQTTFGGLFPFEIESEGHFDVPCLMALNV